MDELLAILTPEVLTLIAYVVGAGIIGFTIIAGVLYVCDRLDLMP
jgi:hypothetical protein